MKRFLPSFLFFLFSFHIISLFLCFLFFPFNILVFCLIVHNVMITRDFKSAFIGILKRLFCSCCPVSFNSISMFYYFHILNFSEEFGEREWKIKMSINPPQEEESRRQSNDSWEEKPNFQDFHLTWDEINTDDISLGFKRRSWRRGETWFPPKYFPLPP